MGDAERGQGGRAGPLIIRKRGGLRLAIFVIGNFLEQGGADSLGDPTTYLPVDNHRVNDGATVFGDGVVLDLDVAGLRVDQDDRGMR